MAEMIWNGVVAVYDFIMDNIVIINVLLALIIVFFQRRSPQTVWTWLLLLYFIPILGFILYLVIGQDFHKSRMFKAKEIEGELKYAVRRQEETIYHERLQLANPEMARFKDLILYNLEAGEAVLTDNNDIRIYTDGHEKFRALIDEMRQARRYIHIQYYIIRNDELWQAIEEVLIEKARHPGGGVLPGAAGAAAAACELPESPQDRGDRRTDWIRRRFQCGQGVSGTG